MFRCLPPPAGPRGARFRWVGRPPGRPLAARLTARGGGDAGITLLEVVTTTSIMMVAMALAGGGIVQIYRNVTKNDSMAFVQTQLHTAFLRLDREIRYASGISRPEQVRGAWYVEYQIAQAGVTDCTQLRLTRSTGLLQSRRMRNGNPTGSWSTHASSLTGTHRFTRIAASPDGARHQQLEVTLAVAAGSGNAQSRRDSAFVFTALNTTVDTTSDAICGAMGRP